MPKIHYTHFPVTSPYTGRLQLVGNKSLYWNLGNDKTQQTQRTYAHTNLLQGLVTDLPFTLWTCYGDVTNLLQSGYREPGVMDFGL